MEFKQILKGLLLASVIIVIMVWIDISHYNYIGIFSTEGIILFLNFLVLVGAPLFLAFSTVGILFYRIYYKNSVLPSPREVSLKATALCYALSFVFLSTVMFRSYGIYFEDYPVTLGYWSGILFFMLRFVTVFLIGYLIYKAYIRLFSLKTDKSPDSRSSTGEKMNKFAFLPGNLLFAFSCYVIILIIYGWMYGGNPAGQVKGFLLGRNHNRPGLQASSVDYHENREVMDRRVIILGIDGFGWNIADNLIEKGQMPAFEFLKGNASWGYLETFKPTSSPLIWTTMATGHSPGEHGIIGYIEYEFMGMDNSIFLNLARGFNRYFSYLGKYTPFVNSYPVLSTKRTRKALWEIIDECNGSSAVFNWWPSRPVDDVSGVIVSDYAVRSMLSMLGNNSNKPKLDPGAIKPLSFISEISDSMVLGGLSAEDVAIHRYKIDTRPENLTLALNCMSKEGRIAAALGLYAMSNINTNLIAIYMRDTDNHFFWEYVQPEFFNGVEMENPDSRMVPAAYMAVDRVVEEYLKAMNSNDYLIIVSDHSIRAVLWEAKSTGSHGNAPPGSIVIFGEGIKRGYEITDASVFDVAPTVMALLGIPISKEIKGQPLTDGFTWGFETANPVLFTETYGTREIHEFDYTETTADVEFKKKLKALGYLE
ncbi:MAG: hypothetical protein GF307_13250 [candidate division Zixibacteria bacterium]|nr:hypothetical protein [candidate division Zixibacteria bacterium]